MFIKNFEERWKYFMKNKMRESNIELLRIIAIIGVMVLHYNNRSMGGGFRYVEEGTLNYYILFWLEGLFVCAVDLFILISGYFLSSTYYRKTFKIINLVFEVQIINILFYFARAFMGKEKIEIETMIEAVIPCNYFVILYATIYIISPYINIMIMHLSQKQLAVFCLQLFLLFSVWPTLVDFVQEITGKEWMGISTIGAYGSQFGYSIVNFALLYVIGTFLRHNQIIIENIKKKYVVLVLLACSLILGVWGQFLENSAWEYCNPVVIFEAIAFFLLFKKLEIRSKFVNIAAEGTFTCFLLHTYIIGKVGIEKAVQSNIFFLLFHIAATVIVIYLFCLFVHYIYILVSTPLFRKIEKITEKIDLILYADLSGVSKEK